MTLFTYKTNNTNSIYLSDKVINDIIVLPNKLLYTIL